MSKISVVLPVYNGEKYLKDAIDSILNQTFEDFELIIINDGSKDNSKKIISNYSDKRIIYIEQENKGFAKALNIGASHCKGEFIARMDQDDISVANRFFIQYTFLQNNPGVSVLSGAVNYINENGYYLGRSFPVTWPCIIKKKLLTAGSVVCHPGVMIRKKDFDNVGGFSEKIGSRFTDYHLWVKFVKKGYKIRNLSQIILQYRITESSMSSEFSLDSEGKKTLINVIQSEHPTENEIDNLNRACKNSQDTYINRKHVYINRQNYIYRKFSFLGEGLTGKLLCSAKNFLALLS